MSNALKFVASCRLPTEWGEFTMHGFEEEGGQEHVALTMGDVSDGLPVLSRIHSECLTGDALFSVKCDCGPQLQAAMQAVQKEGRGVIRIFAPRRQGHWFDKQNPCLSSARSGLGYG